MKDEKTHHLLSVSWKLTVRMHTLVSDILGPSVCFFSSGLILTYWFLYRTRCLHSENGIISFCSYRMYWELKVSLRSGHFYTSLSSYLWTLAVKSSQWFPWLAWKYASHSWSDSAMSNEACIVLKDLFTL